MLQRQGREDAGGGHLCIHGRAYLRACDEHLADGAVIEATDRHGEALAIHGDVVRLTRAAIRQAVWNGVQC